MTTNIEITKPEATRPQATETTRSRPVVTPDVDIIERTGELVVVADLPGVDEKNIEVTLENNILSFTGRPSVASPAGYTPTHAERVEADYSRSFTVSEDIDREKIAASIRNGVLRITLPKAPAAQPRKIAVQAN